MNRYFHQLSILMTTSFLIMMTMTSTTYIEAIDVELPDTLKEDVTQTLTHDKDMVVLIPIKEESPTTNSIPAMNPSHITPSIEIKKSPYRALLKRNEDYRGWITVNGTDISYPLVKGEDNDYYLKRSFDAIYDTKGTIYMDYRNLGFGISKHIILYGHNMKDGTMFGQLKNYKEESFALTNRYIEIEDFYGTRYFKIYASYYSEADSSLITTDFSNNEDYITFINKQISQSDVTYNLQPAKNDSILTLVTCSYEVDNGRYLVHAVEVDTPI